ncbi:hypothetical protein NYR97_11645 [Xanthomonas hydrangeae]|uniref:Phosphatidate cytidylyltransferase n=1 Tax=Xanthomonas hydrangeae TaxID=2775159 RepID=A0AAU0B4R7_9XANT|nr:hypothetical protein [Xanthomonas hydrangeae]WOB47947.1 hypothetical protein NYR97_11645 [Xanthomonas hydrangeae]
MILAITVGLAILMYLRPAQGTRIVSDALVFLLLSILMYQLYVVAVMSGMLFSLRVELRRKTAHLLGGFMLVLAALLTATSAVVVALCLLLLGWLIATRKLPSLKMYRQLSVDRRDGTVSWGDLWFPVGLGGTAILFGAQSAEWLAAALVLTLADSAAALTGTRFPSPGYRIAGGRKSLGGTCACLIAASVCIVLAGWASGLNWSWIGCFGLAAVVTTVEAVSTRGLDNLLLPLATAVGLSWLEGIPAIAWLAVGTICLLLLAALSAWQKWSQSLHQVESSGLQPK